MATEPPNTTRNGTGYRGLGAPCGAFVLDLLRPEDSPWHETEAEIRQGLAEGAERARRLAWVESRMASALTAVERRALALYYFENLSYREAGQRLNRNASSVCRAVRRALRKLREAARDDPPR